MSKSVLLSFTHFDTSSLSLVDWQPPPASPVKEHQFLADLIRVDGWNVKARNEWLPRLRIISLKIYFRLGPCCCLSVRINKNAPRIATPSNHQHNTLLLLPLWWNFRSSIKLPDYSARSLTCVWQNNIIIVILSWVIRGEERGYNEPSTNDEAAVDCKTLVGQKRTPFQTLTRPFQTINRLTGISWAAQLMAEDVQS